eukprot:8166769-Alexandrium_andersonii.AAC.1
MDCGPSMVFRQEVLVAKDPTRFRSFCELWCAADANVACRSCLQAHRHPPEHVFGDIFEVVPAE